MAKYFADLEGVISQFFTFIVKSTTFVLLSPRLLPSYCEDPAQ